MGQFERYGWLGYEPSRFGLPELHWGMLGVVVPGTGWWSWGAELRGRATGKFSQLSLRTAIGLGVTDFFHAGWQQKSCGMPWKGSQRDGGAEWISGLAFRLRHGSKLG